MKNDKTLPHFLGIGAQRSGTTWLYINLRKHPMIWMPPEKEIHYFDRSPSYITPNKLASEKFLSRIMGKGPEYQKFRKNFSLLLKYSFNFYKKEWRWYFKYLTGKYNDAWYLSLFKYGRDKVCGEITPSYSILNAGDVNRIKTLMPDVKILFILRNPIERAWSHFCFDYGKIIRSKGSVSINEIKQFMDSPRQNLRSDYLRTLNIWHSQFSEKQFLIGFFDDINHKPEEFLAKIFNFLGLDPRKFTKTNSVGKRRNKSTEMEMPESIKKYLVEKYYGQIRELSCLFGSHAIKWRETIDKK